MQRRGFLAATGVIAIGWTAGCSDILAEDDEATTDSASTTTESGDEVTGDPVAVVEEFYQRVADMYSVDSVNSYVEAGEDVLVLYHSEAPLRRRLERQISSLPENYDPPNDAVNLDSLETSIFDENFDEAELREIYPDLAEEEDSPDGLNPITAAAGENTVVSASINPSVAQTFGVSTNSPWLTTQEGNGWRVVGYK